MIWFDLSEVDDSHKQLLLLHTFLGIRIDSQVGDPAQGASVCGLREPEPRSFLQLNDERYLYGCCMIVCFLTTLKSGKKNNKNGNDNNNTKNKSNKDIINDKNHKKMTTTKKPTKTMTKTKKQLTLTKK